MLNKDWKFKEQFPEVSAYTTTWNCAAGGYPVEESILSFSWCDKIIVVDGGSTDGTRERLEKLKEQLGDKLEIYDIPIDEANPGKDGYQKAMSLAMCATPFAIQFDVDEICKGDPQKWKSMIKDSFSSTDILNLPVMEPYGELSRIRINEDHTPWKWRVYRTKPEISHGIPEGDRLEQGGKIYSKGGSDGCVPIHVVNNQLYPSKAVGSARKLTELKRKRDWAEYKLAWEALVGSGEPYILHLGHVNLKQKIEHYLSSWRVWWNQLYNKDPADPKNNLFFPGVELSNIDEKMIGVKVEELKNKTLTIELAV